MKISEALSGVTILGFDTPPLIYFIERDPSYFELVKEIFEHVNPGTITTVTEVLTLPRRFADASLEAEYLDLFFHSGNFRLVEIDTPVADTAATLRAQYGLRTPDALQISAALSAGCEAFLTNDLNLRRVTELRVLALDDLQL